MGEGEEGRWVPLVVAVVALGPTEVAVPAVVAYAVYVVPAALGFAGEH